MTSKADLRISIEAHAEDLRRARSLLIEEKQKYFNLRSAYYDLQREHAKCGPANSDPEAAQETRDAFSQFLESLGDFGDLLGQWVVDGYDEPEPRHVVRRFCT